jgi:carbon storage regulator
MRRHPGESFRIGDAVEIVVIECGPGRVKLGIRAPQEIPVVRTEVRITREENLAAARAFRNASAFVMPPPLKLPSPSPISTVKPVSRTPQNAPDAGGGTMPKLQNRM